MMRKIEAVLYYDVDYLHVRVPHVVLPPSNCIGMFVLSMKCMAQSLIPKLRGTVQQSSVE